MDQQNMNHYSQGGGVNPDFSGSTTKFLLFFVFVFLPDPWSGDTKATNVKSRCAISGPATNFNVGKQKM